MSANIRASLATVRTLESCYTNSNCTRLVLSINRPFRTDYLQMFVEDPALLIKTDCGRRCEIGDDVELMYYYNVIHVGYPRLVSLTTTTIEYCPICRNGLRLGDRCDECLSYSIGEHKEYVNETMTLISCVCKDYIYSPGYRMEFVSHMTGATLAFVVFPSKHILYPKVKNFVVGREYTINGWRDTRNRYDIIDVK